MEQAIQILRPTESYSWGTHAGAELDLIFLHKGKRFGMEFKFNEAPGLTPSMRTASSELKLNHLWIVYPGAETYLVEKGITALPLIHLDTLKEQFA